MEEKKEKKKRKKKGKRKEKEKKRGKEKKEKKRITETSKSTPLIPCQKDIRTTFLESWETGKQARNNGLLT